MYYTIWVKVLYGKLVVKRIKKRKIPGEVWMDFRDAFESLARSGNFRLFDIKKLVRKKEYVYCRLRIGGYRALFHMDENRIFVEDIATRGEIYKP